MKFAFAAAILKIETLRMRKRFARVLRKSTHGFPFVSHMSMGLRLAALWASELRYEIML